MLLTTVNTLFSIYEWIVMSMGKTNILAIYQQYITLALLPLIRKIYHIYIDYTII